MIIDFQLFYFLTRYIPDLPSLVIFNYFSLFCFAQPPSLPICFWNTNYIIKLKKYIYMHFNNCTEKGNLCNPLFELNYKQWLQDEDVHREHSWTTTIKPLFHSYMRRFVSCFPTFMFSFGIAASMVVYSAGNKTCNKVIIKKYWWKTGWPRISIMCSGGATCLPMDCCLTIKNQLSMLV